MNERPANNRGAIGSGIDQLRTPREAAILLACSKKRIYRLVADGDLEAVKLSARGTRISESALARFVEGRRIR